MSRRNDLWIMNSLSFDNVIAIQEQNFVATSAFQTDLNKADSNMGQPEDKRGKTGLEKIDDHDTDISTHTETTTSHSNETPENEVIKGADAVDVVKVDVVGEPVNNLLDVLKHGIAPERDKNDRPAEIQNE